MYLPVFTRAHDSAGWVDGQGSQPKKKKCFSVTCT